MIYINLDSDKVENLESLINKTHSAVVYIAGDFRFFIQ